MTTIRAAITDVRHELFLAIGQYDVVVTLEGPRDYATVRRKERVFGIWMNTQRPEWNDANNALVGHGISVVTLGYLRRTLHHAAQHLLPADTGLQTPAAPLPQSQSPSPCSASR